MKRLKTYVLLIIVVLSLFFVKGIHALFVFISNPKVNTFSIQNTYSYTVIHKQMDLNGSTYTTVAEAIGYATVGSSVTPEVLSYTGFTSPQSQTVTINSNNQTITYLYTRNQYLLTINDSQYVTTQTPSGTYYYGQPIHLVAAADDGQGHIFVKWTDDTTNADYTFNLSEDTTIGPVYANAYSVTFEQDNGLSPITQAVVQGDSLGSLPTVTKDDCVLPTGNNYNERQCTYAYKFIGWFTEPGFVNQVNEDFVPTGDCTLYAKWTKVYFGNEGPVTFNGTSDYINTEIKLFSEENADKDFIVTFTVDSKDGNGYVTDRGTVFADMNEKAEPFPGVHFYIQNSSGKTYWLNVNILGNKVKNGDTGYALGQKVTIKRDDGIIYYKYDDGPFIQINDFTNFDAYFNNNATFGAGTKANGDIYRYFKGTISDMSVELFDPESYTIHFDANGGTGMMIDQTVKVGKTVSLEANTYTKTDRIFGGWNTMPDGSGTSYANKAQFSSLAGDGDVVTLYAQWLDHYYIHFDANGGTGSMPNQEIYLSNPDDLTPNSYTKANYVFFGWNTKADGTGDSYIDGESTSHISHIDGDSITLYAQYLKPVFVRNGAVTFDGTINTFIDTGVNFLSEQNLNKDFEVRFTISSVGTVSGEQPTIFSAKDEQNPKYPGFALRFNDVNSNLMIPVYRWSNGSGTNMNGISKLNVPIEVIYRRRDRVVTIQYKYANFDSGIIEMYNQRNWTLNQYATTNATFGGIYKPMADPDDPDTLVPTPFRFFNGTLSDIRILIDD